MEIFLILLALCIQGSFQSSVIEPSAITATCQYGFDDQNRYTCNLFNAGLHHPSDTLTIIGNHLPGYTNANVQVVAHQTTVNRFHGEVLRTFLNLRILKFVNVRLSFIQDNAFDSCGQLEELNIMSNELTSLPSQMLRNCGNLRSFIGTGSFQLQSIPGNLFGSNRNLEVFVATGGELTSFPPNLLENMSNLRVFNVSGNHLSNINPNNFRSTQNLQEFGIAFNQFTDGQTIMNILSGRLSLRRIRIMNNPFPIFNFNFFEQFPRLEDLAVGGRQSLTEINWQSLPEGLTSLGVAGIGEEVPENAFNRFTNLTNLLLTGSGITSLPGNIFNALTRLERLLIMETRLSTLHPQFFANLGNLRLLHLNFNQIEELPEGIFAPLVNLGHMEFIHGLFLMSNKLTRIPSNAFGRHPQLRQINFNGNQINEIERGVFGLFNAVLVVDLRSNVCVNAAFTDVRNLDQNRQLQTCFNNFERENSTPDGAESIFRRFEIFVIFAVGFMMFLMN